MVLATPPATQPEPEPRTRAPNRGPNPTHYTLECTPHPGQVRVELPELSSAAGVDLDITERLLSLAAPKASYALKLPLPYAVRGLGLG